MKFFTILLLFTCCALPPLPSQTAAAVLATQPSVSSDLTEFQAIEDHWSDAVTKRDQFGLELVLAPQLVDISSTGGVTNRNQQIVALFRKDSPIVSLEQKVISIRYLAAGAVAVVNGTYVLHTKTGSTKTDEKGIFTHVFTHLRTNWLCINSQRTLVVERVLAKPKAQANKKGGLPLKVPLVYGGERKP